MNLEHPHTVRNLVALACALLTAAVVAFSSFVNNQQTQINNQLVDEFAEYIVDEMPACALRSNLLIVFGTEYAGDSQELNELLQAFSQMKIQELSKDKSL
jgi:uncharacterized membrane protein affecting hemolysin expression